MNLGRAEDDDLIFNDLWQISKLDRKYGVFQIGIYNFEEIIGH